MAPPVECRKRPQDGISRVQKVAAVELGFRGALRWFGRAPPPSWGPRASTELLLPPIYIHVPPKHPGAP